MTPVASRSSQTAGGRWVDQTEKKAGADLGPVTLTTTTTSPAFDIEDALQIDAQLTITTASGTTPSMTTKLQTTVDGTNWYDVGSFPAQTAAGNISQSFGGSLGMRGRWVHTITGTTPSFTFSIDTQARRGL